MAVTYLGINDPRIPELQPNLGLISLREQFGVPGEFLLSDDNQYFTNMNDNQPIEKIDDGIGSIINQNIIPPYLIPTDGNGGGDNNIIIPRSTYDENLKIYLMKIDKNILIQKK